MSTRMEFTGKRDLFFSNWIRTKLPDSETGYLVSDIDFFIYNYKTKKIAIIEVKTRNSCIKNWQRMFYKNINKWLKKGIDDEWEFKGVHLIKFENTDFTNGRVYFDNVEITEGELIQKLSF